MGVGGIVEQLPVYVRPARLVQARTNRYAGHVFHARHQHGVGIASRNLQIARMQCSHARAALLVNEFGRGLLGEIGQKRGRTAAVGPLLVHAQSAAHDEIINGPGFHARTLEQFGQNQSQQFVRAQRVEPVHFGFCWPRAGKRRPQIACYNYVFHIAILYVKFPHIPVHGSRAAALEIGVWGREAPMTLFPVISYSARPHQRARNSP